MEIEIQSKKNNPLLNNRTEVYFTIRHVGEGTPNREIIRSELAEKLNTNKEKIIVNYMRSDFGTEKTIGYAKIYTSVEKAKDGERDYILIRNNLIAKEKPKKKEEKKEEAAGEKPEEKPKEQEEKPEIVEETPAEKPEEKAEETKETPEEEPPKKEEQPAEQPPETTEEPEKTEEPPSKQDESEKTEAEEKPAEEKKEEP